MKKPIVCHILMNTEIGGVISVVDEIIKSNEIVNHIIVSLNRSHPDYKHKDKSFFYELNYQYDISYSTWSYLRTALFPFR